MVKGFREYTDAVEGRKQDRYAIYHYATGDQVAELVLNELLNEAKKYVDLGKGRSIMFHKAHIPDGQDHLHFRVDGAKIAAVNKDGSAHDRSHGVQLQRWAIDGAKAHYPDFKLPKDGLIEQLHMPEDRTLLLEAVEGRVLVSKAVRLLALVKATMG
jgi:hypothetical protein